MSETKTYSKQWVENNWLDAKWDFDIWDEFDMCPGDTVVMAKCDGYVDVDTNVRQIVNVLKHKDNYINILIDNGNNLKNRFISRFYWYIRKFLFKK